MTVAARDGIKKMARKIEAAKLRDRRRYPGHVAKRIAELLDYTQRTCRDVLSGKYDHLGRSPLSAP